MKHEERLGRPRIGGSVPVDPDIAPRYVARHIEIAFNVDAALEQLRRKEVEPVDGLGVEVCHAQPVLAADKSAVVVMDAHGVVADGRKALGQHNRRLVVWKVCVVAEVRAPEALRNAGKPLELEVAAFRDDAPELARRRVAVREFREVKRRSRLDRLAILERNPALAGGNDKLAGA